MKVDAAALSFTIHSVWKFVAKRELTWIPFFGWALAISQRRVIDRRNREAPVASLAAAERDARRKRQQDLLPGELPKSGSDPSALQEPRHPPRHSAGVPLLPVPVRIRTHLWRPWLRRKWVVTLRKLPIPGG